MVKQSQVLFPHELARYFSFWGSREMLFVTRNGGGGRVFLLFFFFCVKGSKEFHREKPAILKVVWLRKLLRGFFSFLNDRNLGRFVQGLILKDNYLSTFQLVPLQTSSSVVPMISAIWKTGETTTTLQDSGKKKPVVQNGVKENRVKHFQNFLLFDFSSLTHKQWKDSPMPGKIFNPITAAFQSQHASVGAEHLAHEKFLTAAICSTLCPGFGVFCAPAMGWARLPSPCWARDKSWGRLCWSSRHGWDKYGKMLQRQQEQSHFYSSHPVLPNGVVSATHSKMQPQLSSPPPT